MIFLVSSQSYYLDREGVVQFYLSRVFYTFIYAIPVTLKTQCMCLWCHQIIAADVIVEFKNKCVNKYQKTFWQK